MKYGYQDSENPKRIKWRVVLNAVQDKLNNMVIKDDFSDSGQVLVEALSVPFVMQLNQKKFQMKQLCLNWNQSITLAKKLNSLEMRMVKSQGSPLTLVTTGTGQCTLSTQQS